MKIKKPTQLLLALVILSASCTSPVVRLNPRNNFTEENNILRIWGIELRNSGKQIEIKMFVSNKHKTALKIPISDFICQFREGKRRAKYYPEEYSGILGTLGPGKVTGSVFIHSDEKKYFRLTCNYRDSADEIKVIIKNVYAENDDGVFKRVSKNITWSPDKTGN